MIEILSDGASVDQSTETLMKDALEAVFRAEHASGSATILLTNEDGIRDLNRVFRHMDAVTDVLTFPAWEGEGVLAPPDGYIGDIAICVPRAAEQAAAYGHSVAREFAFLSVHGGLHLMGYDHMTDADEKRMFQKQDEILNEMGITR